MLFIGFFYYAYWKEVSNPPLDGNVAPFHDTMTNKTEQQISRGEFKEEPIDKPHRTPKQLRTWLSMVLSESLTFEDTNYQEKLKRTRQNFTNSGFRDYINFLKTINIAQQLDTYDVGVFAEQIPAVGKGFEDTGVYRWRAQAPVTISFKARQEKQMINKKYIIFVQMRRVRVPGDPFAIQIEGWQTQRRR